MLPAFPVPRPPRKIPRDAIKQHFSAPPSSLPRPDDRAGGARSHGTDDQR